MTQLHEWSHSDDFASYKGVKVLASLWEQEFWPYEELLQSVAVPGTRVFWTSPDSNSVTMLMTSFLLVRETDAEAEVFFMFTPPAFRGQGLARKLLQFALEDWTRGGRIGQCFLEVRPSNTAAIAIYEHNGFKMIQRRKKYYRDGEDALIYEWVS